MVKKLLQSAKRVQVSLLDILKDIWTRLQMFLRRLHYYYYIIMIIFHSKSHHGD